jgi:hypothetical protein
MEYHYTYVKMLSLEFVLSIGLGLFLLSTIQVSAQPLTKDTLTGNVTEVDISIDPAEPLPANGTVTISTEGATDTDMNAFPPEGVYVIISSDTVTITNQTIDIPMPEEEEDQESESNGGGGLEEESESNGGGGGLEEESESNGGGGLEEQD